MKVNNKKNQNILKCLVCQARYENDHIKIVSNLADKTIFHLTCRKCSSKAINILSVTASGILGIGVLTDLDIYEVNQIRTPRTISLDEVIDVHEMMKVSPGHFLANI